MNRCVLYSAAAVLAASVMFVPAAQATISPGTATVSVPGPARTDLQLIGLNTFGYAAAQNGGSVVAAPADDQPLHGSLVDYNTPFHSSTAVASDLTGVFVRWAEPKGSAWVVHRANVTGGGQTDYDTPDRPVAFSPAGWVSYASGTLKYYLPGGATRTLLTGLTAQPQVRADYGGAVVLYQVMVGGKSHTRAALITFAPMKVEVLADHDDTVTSGEVATSIALTPNTVVWYAKNLPVDVLGTFHRRAREGGAVENIAQPAQRSGNDLVATDDTIAMTEIRNNPMTGPVRHLWAKTGAAAWREIMLPAGSALDSDALRASDTQIGFALSGGSAVAGVYTIGAGSPPTRKAEVSPRPSTITDVSLQAGRLTFAARPPGSAADYASTPLYRATVTTGGTLSVVSPAGVFLPGVSPAHARTGTPAPGVSVSGDRVATRVDSSGVRGRLTDDTASFVQQTGTVTSREQPLKRSGSYLLWNTKVYQGDDLTPVKDLSSENCRGTDIFGQFVICSKASGDVDVIDVTGHFGRWSVGGDGAGPVAIWGLNDVWVDSAGKLQFQDATTPAHRRTWTVGGGIHDLRLTEGAIWWRDDTGVIKAIDLDTRVSSSPVSTGLKAPADVDDHLVAGVDASGNLQVRTLPFGPANSYRPRLIDAVYTDRFAPATAAWKPVFDIAKPVQNVKVTIRQNNAVVATLTGSAATGTTGTVRDLAWNGKTTAGTDAPAGSYTWTLTADARDGDGSVTNIDGASAVSGYVYLTR